MNDDLLVTLLSKAEVAVDTAGLPFIADVVARVVGFGFACMEEINWFDHRQINNTIKKVVALHS